MPDIELRFNRDMLVLSAPVDAVLERQGIDAARDRQYLNLMEPDAMHDAQRLELMAGAQCLVTSTEDITSARLAHLNMSGDAVRLAQAALDIANELKPQHVLAEIGPCGLPLDPSSKASLNENRAQYADAARAFGDGLFDAFFLNRFTNVSDLKCALMGVGQVSGKPVFASVTIGEAGEAGEANADLGASDFGVSAADVSAESSSSAGALPFVGASLAFVDSAPTPPAPSAHRVTLNSDQWEEAILVMADLGVSVVGFETSEPIAKAVEYAQRAVACTDLPVLAQLRVRGKPSATSSRGLVPLHEIDEYTPDTMQTAAVKLYGAGVQFLRATGMVTPAYTGALAATVAGLDVHRK